MKFLPSRQPVLLLDMDGPLAAFDEHGFRRLAEAGIPLDVPTPQHQTRRFFTDHLVHRHHHSKVREMIATPGWFEGLPVVEGAVDGVRALIEAGVDVWVCTKPLEDNPTCRDDKAAWLRRHLPELEHKLIIAPDKSLVHGHVLLDDAPKLSWIPRASWKPVVFTTAFNGAGSEWANLPHWDWSQPLGALLYALQFNAAGAAR